MTAVAVSSTTSIAVHRVGVAGAADGDDPPAGDAEARAAHAEHGVGDEPADDRDLHPAALRAHAEPVAHRVAEAGEDAVRAAASSPSGTSHRSLSPSRRRRAQAPRYPRSRAQRQRRLARAVGVQRAVDEAAVPAHDARAAERARAARRAARPGRRTTFTPAAIASRSPQAAARSKRSARLTSKKWKCDVTPTGTSPSLTTSSGVARPSSHSSGDLRGRRRRVARRSGRAARRRRLPSREQRLDLDPAAPRSRRPRARRRRPEHARSRAPRRPRRSAVARGLAHLVGDQRDRLGLRRAAARGRAARGRARRRGRAAAGPPRAGGASRGARRRHRAGVWTTRRRQRAAPRARRSRVGLRPCTRPSARPRATSRSSSWPARSCEATFVPGAGMVGCSLRHRGRGAARPARRARRLARHRQVLRPAAAPPLGEPAARLALRRGRPRRRARPLPRRRAPRRERPAHPRRDGRRGGLGGHGLRGGRRRRAARRRARLRAARRPPGRVPVPHRLGLDDPPARRHGRRHDDGDADRATCRSRWPSAGIPGSGCPACRARSGSSAMPAREHLPLDDRSLPTGEACAEAAERAPLADRVLDDHYAVGDGRALRRWPAAAARSPCRGTAATRTRRSSRPTRSRSSASSR